MPISSRNFFHFTNCIEYLRDILENGFWPRYCKEYGWGNMYEFAIPMVCFCDIPLSQISEHAKFYGCWGIGVKPSWGKLHKDFTPVQYIASQSTEFNLVNRLITTLKNGTIDDIGIKKLILAKKVSGIAIAKSGISSVRKFYDEREWRYVPSSLEYEKLIIPVKKKTEFDTNEYSKFTEQLKLPIEPEYISYLIIPSEHYRTKMISELKSIYGSIKKKDILHILISRIVSLEQIQDDF
jgi:hypothetical protein